MALLPIRFRDRQWQVSVENGWLVCETEADAYQIAASADLALATLDGDLDEDVAKELEACAALCIKFACINRAAFPLECAKFARGQPTELDQFID